MLIKIKDHRIVASEVMCFKWVAMNDQVKDHLVVSMKTFGNIVINGPKTLLDDFEKQYNAIMGYKYPKVGGIKP